MGHLVKTVLFMLAEMRLAQRVSRFSGAVKWLILAAICGLAAGAALVAALWLFLVPRLGADAAALSMAGVLAALSGLFMLIARTTLHPHRVHTTEPDADAAAELKEMFAKNKGAALLSAVIAGLAMGTGKK